MTEETWNWSVLPGPLRARAREILQEQLLEQGLTDVNAALQARVLPSIDISRLAIGSALTGEHMMIGRGRVKTLRDQGRLPYMVLLRTGGWPHSVVYWKCVVQAWGEYKTSTSWQPGRGRRWEPDE